MQIKGYLWGGELIAPTPLYFISPFENPSVSCTVDKCVPPHPKTIRKFRFHDTMKHRQIHVVITCQFVLSFMQL